MSAAGRLSWRRARCTWHHRDCGGCRSGQDAAGASAHATGGVAVNHTSGHSCCHSSHQRTCHVRLPQETPLLEGLSILHWLQAIGAQADLGRDFVATGPAAGRIWRARRWRHSPALCAGASYHKASAAAGRRVLCAAQSAGC
eukprot:6199927-Pleurochrysis_carterae.AAC.1